MSHNFYNSLWADAQQEYRSLIQEERRVIPGIETEDSTRLFEFLADLYIKYVSVFKKIDLVYDQVVHPQKRPLIRKMLDLIIVRILEIRHVITETELSQFFYFDDILQWMHWIPDDLDINTPRYYIHERGPEFAMREKWLESETAKKLAEEEGIFGEEEDLELPLTAEERLMSFKVDPEDKVEMELDKAVRFIQTAERARQGRQRFQMAKFICEEEERARGKKKRMKQLHMSPLRAAIIIQLVVRRFLAYRRVQRQRNEELEFLGLNFNRHKTNTPMGQLMLKSKEWQKKIEAHAEKRREIQRQNLKTYMEAQSVIETRLRLMEAPELAEDLKCQLRNWMLQVKEKTNRLPDIPKAEFGGSGYIFATEKQSDQMSVAASEKPTSAKSSSVVSSGKKKGKKGKKAESAGQESKDKRGSSEEKEMASALEPPRHFEEMIEANIDYNTNWRMRDETRNPEQGHEDQIITDAKRNIIGNEVRIQVDIMMKNELLLLKEALQRKKGKKGKKSGKKSGKSGKGGKKGKKKKKRTKDLTPDRTLESLYCELVTNNVIRKFPKVRFEDLVGESSLVNGCIRRYHAADTGSTIEDPAKPNFPSNPHPPPSFGDVKRVVRDVCVLPMGSSTVHQLAPFTKSILITGPEGSGKNSLVYAVCTELGATLFDLTPANIAGTYPGKPGLNMLMHLIAKVGRLVQPTILLIDECEKTYQKRVAKTDKTEPKRLKKPLAKFLKSVGPEDQIMLIGLSAEPWAAPIKVMKKDYERIIYIPKPHHGDRFVLWERLLAKHSNQLHHDVHLSLLAKLSDGWTFGAITEVVANLTRKHYEALEEAGRYRTRAAPSSSHSGSSSNKNAPVVFKPAKIGRKLMRMDDFLKELSVMDPLFFEQEKLWNGWFSKTPMQRARMAAFEAKEENTKPKKVKGKKKKEK